MKILLRTLLGILIVLIIAVAGLFIYLNDARLRALILPEVEQALGREVQIDRIGFALFRTFPNAGVVIEGFSIPDPEHDVLSFQELVVSVQLWPLLDQQVIVNTLEITGANVTYAVFPDGSTSFDFLMASDSTETSATASPTTIDLQQIVVQDAVVNYIDLQSDMSATLSDLDSEMSLTLGETIQSDMMLSIGGVSVISSGTQWLSELPVSLQQSFELDTTNESFNMKEGILKIRGLDLQVAGVLSNWTAEAMNLNFEFNSSSDNFASLLDLVPDAYQAEMDGIETRGALVFNGSISGQLSDASTPDFQVVLQVKDGFLKHPDAGKPIENVQIDVSANNQLVTINSFTANADVNLIDVKGTLNAPLEPDNSEFELLANLKLDLSTVPEFYPIDPDTMRLNGAFTFDGAARGKLNDAENATVSGEIKLTDGMLFHRSLPHPVERITIDSRMSATELTIRNVSLQSGSNTLQSSGRIRNYLSDNPELDIALKTDMNLGEIDQYYSMEETGFEVSGLTNADLTLRGPISDFNAVRFSGSARFTDVAVNGDSLPAPISNVNGTLNFSNNDVQLTGYTMNMADSDFKLEGRLQDWKNLFEEPGSVSPARLTATYVARKLNIDTFVDWDEESDEPLIIELPNLVSELNASIDTLQIMGVQITNIRGQGQTNPKLLQINSATAEMFGGKAKGQFIWNIYQPDYTIFRFVGGLENLQAQAFFREFEMGGANKLAQFISGGFNTQVDYQSGLGANMVQDAPTINATGGFGFSNAQVQNHPLQKSIATFLNIPEFAQLAMDAWNTNFKIENGVLELRDLKFTSRFGGFTLNGSQNLVDTNVNYEIQVLLPASFSERLSNLVPGDALAALRTEENMIMLPLLVDGTVSSPSVSLNRDVVQDLVTQYLRSRGTDQVEDAARRLLRGIRGN
jgi:hypothetical protein